MSMDPDRTLVDGVIDDLSPDAAEQNGWAMRRVAMECLRRARLTNGSEVSHHG